MMEREARPRSTMDSIRASEAPDPGSIPGEATFKLKSQHLTGSNEIGTLTKYRTGKGFSVF
jgi:hypothetical protein